MLRIVFHGDNAACFAPGFAQLLPPGASIATLPDLLSTADQRSAYAEAEVIVGVHFNESLPQPRNLRLFHVPGAGYDAIKLDLVPKEAVVCNCFGHDPAIAEYVFAGMLSRHVPLADADAKLRTGNWAYWSGSTDRLHGEISGKTVGLLGFGHIGQAVARRAKAFDMRVIVGNRSPVATSSLVDESFTLDVLDKFWAESDFIVVSLPLTPSTMGIVDAAAFSMMRPGAVIFNVGRGPTIDETALYEALRDDRIAGAVIDTWYTYPGIDTPNPKPSQLPFHELSNLVMTPHMSGWTAGTVRRRQETIASNIRHLIDGAPAINVVRNTL